jgi:hypothetical protein
MNIYNNSVKDDFIPTWLYIKKHNITGLKYFGRTTSKDPIKYKGSGKWWTRHLKMYGNDVTTVWCHLYEDKHVIQEEAIAFSVSHNIVESKEWANLMIEDGINGSVKGHYRGEVTADTRKKLSTALKGKPGTMLGRTQSEETKEKIRQAIKNKGCRSEDTKMKLSNANIGKKLSDATKKKISESLQGRKCPKSEEHRRKISESLKGRFTGDQNPFFGKTHSTETKQKIIETRRRNN